MKKILTVIPVLLFTLLLVACGTEKSSNEVSQEDLYAISAVAGVNEISQTPLIGRMNMAKGSHEKNEDHLDLMLSLMNDETYYTELLKSDLEGYEHLLDIKINQDEFKFYYNEILVKESSKEDEDELEEEKEYKIEGIIINNNIEYQVTGKKEIEIEEESKGDFETELQLELKISLDEKNYTNVKYEFETEQEGNDSEIEKELKFTTFVDGKRTNQMSIDFELENGKKEVKLRITEGKKISTYKFEEHKNKSTKIKYEIKENGIIDRGTIDVIISVDENGVTKYQYK